MNSYRDVFVYVEGPSDAEGLKVLFSRLRDEKRQRGVSIRFVPSQGKRNLLTRELHKAVNTVLNKSWAEVVLLPDLYPRNQGFDHETPQELFAGIDHRLREILSDKADPDTRVLQRIHSFCFKHDFESLLLAAPDALRTHLNTNSLDVNWVEPVEEQNHEDPPKRVVERLFESCGEKYVETEDAFEILATVDYRELAEACPQSFGPFVDYLEAL